MSLIQPIIGHLLSKYDQTAIEGVDKIIVLAKSAEVSKSSGASKGLRFADEFVSDPQALAALAKFFTRSGCDTAMGYRACITLLENCQQGNRAAFARHLCRQQLFAPIRKLLSTIQEGAVPSTCGCLALMTYLLKEFPKLVLARFGREVPITLGIFKHLTPRTASLRAFRCLFLARFALTSFPQINEKAVTTHGYLTILVEDAAELATSKEHALEGPIVSEAIEAALTALRDAFIVSPHLNKNTKREVLMGQRNVLRGLVRWLGDEKYGPDVLGLMQRLIAELHEESFDYFLHRSEDSEANATASAGAAGANNSSAEFYMPNFSLLAILRLLKPKSFVLHTRLVVFILQKAPDLMRPYFNRVAQHLFEEDRTVSKTNHFAAVVNIMCRVACCPIPNHLADPAVAVINTTSEPNTFFTLTPKAIAEEVCPRGLGEFIHRMINKSDDCLHLLMALQATYAVLRRAEETIACARVILNRNSDKMSAVEAETFLAAAEHELRAHLPRTEEFWHRLTQQLLPIAATPKAQYLLQRMYLVVKRYAEVFRLRTPWISAVPPVVPAAQPDGGPSAPSAKLTAVKDLMRALANPILSWEPKSVSCLCALLLSNLTMNVPLTKLHHITLGGDNSNSSNTNNAKGSSSSHHHHADDAARQHQRLVEASAKDFPALLSLLLWFSANASATSGEAVEAKGFIVQLVLWCVHSVSLRFGASAAEVYLWLSCLTPETAPLLCHLLNNMLQQSLSKAADRVAEQLLKAEHGVIHASALPFIARVRERRAEDREKQQQKSSSSSSSLWQSDLQQHIDAFEKVANKVAKRWAEAPAAYHAEVEVPMGEQLAAQIACLAALRGAALQAREVADVDVPTSAHLVRYLLAHQAPRPADGSADATCALPAFVEVAEERGGSALLQALTPLDSIDTAGSLVVIDNVFKAICKAALAGASDEATEQFLVDLFATPYAAHTVGRALLDIGRAINGATPATLEVPKYAVKFCRLVLAALADGGETGGLLSKMVLAGEEQASGFALSLAAMGALWLHAAKGTFAADAEGRETLTKASATIARSFYGGTLSLVDRAYYAAMLFAELAVQEGNSSDASSPPSSSEKAATSYTLAGHALAAVRTARYSVGRMATASASAPEADALGQLVDGWSDAEIQSLALGTSLKMSNTVRLAAAGAVPNVLRALYPDVGHVSEYELQGRTGPAVGASSASDSVATSSADAAAVATAADESRIMDPRFMLPLLRTTAAMATAQPTAVPTHWVVRCAPFVIVGMSATDAAVRKEASIAFALLSNLSGGYVRSVFQFLRIKYAPHNAANAASVPIPRVPAPLTSFLVSAMLVIKAASHPLHNAVANQFITPAGGSATGGAAGKKEGPQVLTHPCPMAHLLTEFPLQCVVGEQALARQEDSFRQGTTVDSGTTAEAAQAITNKMRSEHPPHVDYILRQLRHSCVTRADAEDLVAANVPSNLFLLAGMLRGAPKARLRVIKVITELATATREAAEVWVSHSSIRVVEWSLFFLMTMGAEAEGEGMETTRHKQCAHEVCARLAAMLKGLAVACRGSAGLSHDLVAQYVCLARQFLTMRAANSQAVGGTIRQLIAVWEQQLAQ